MSSMIENLEWRYATKKFDPDKKVPEKDLNTLLEATRLSASSYGLQPYHILVVSDPHLREQLREVSFDQPQITDASHLIVFASRANLDAPHVDSYLEQISDTRRVPVSSLQKFGEVLKSKIGQLGEQERTQWAEKQAYLALGQLLAAAAELRIDTCPMEGFRNEAYNEILGLDEQGLHASVIAAIGYRSSSDPNQFLEKVRQPAELFASHF